MTDSNGELIIHCAPTYLRQQIEWSIWRSLGFRPHIEWSEAWHSDARIQGRATIIASVSDISALAAVLAGWRQITFELTRHSSTGAPTDRWLHVPEHGISHRPTDSIGSYQVGEFEIRALLAEAKSLEELQASLLRAVADPWEAAIEPFRIAAAERPTRRLYRAS